MSRIVPGGATYVELSTQMIAGCQFIVNYLRQSEKMEIYINNKEYRILSREKYLTQNSHRLISGNKLFLTDGYQFFNVGIISIRCRMTGIPATKEFSCDRLRFYRGQRPNMLLDHRRAQRV